MSVIVVACGSNGASTTGVDPSNPVVTITIHIGDGNGSPTPPLPAYSCGAWATDTTPALNTSSAVNVFAKFVQNVKGNPVGVGGASATATIIWPDQSTSSETVTTTSDGLAVFPVAIKAMAPGKLVFINVTFSKSGTPGCAVQQAAYFTVIVASPTAAPSPAAGGSPTTTPGASPTAGLTPTLTPLPTLPPTATPKPKPTPKH